MQLASYGTRAIPARYLSRLVPHKGSLRSIHIPPRPQPTTAQTLVNTTRTLLTRFFAHLSAPGLSTSIGPSAATARSLYSTTSGSLYRPNIHSIHANLSLPARHALSTSLSRPLFLPRAPAPVPRGMAQVGLGTARNFCSARPIFQNVVQNLNVPVAARAFCEADWEIRAPGGVGKEGWLGRMKEGAAVNSEQGKERVKPNTSSYHYPLFTVHEAEASVTAPELEFEHYFPTSTSTPANATQVTTYLLIPLSPTLSSSSPSNLSLRHPNRHGKRPLLPPLPQVTAIHNAHSIHALRVSSLFARLDAGQVWGRGIVCDAFSTPSTYGSGEDEAGGSGGVCTTLRLTFKGWTAAEVRGVIGESGSGWCELYEEDEDVLGSEFGSEELEELGSVFSGEDGSGSGLDVYGPGDSSDVNAFILPTLDFSSSFLAQPQPQSLAPSQSPLSGISRSSSWSPSSESGSESGSWVADIDIGTFASPPFSPPSPSSSLSFSDLDSDSEGSWVQPPSHGYGFGFSSDFLGRVVSGGGAYSEGPREVLF